METSSDDSASNEISPIDYEALVFDDDALLYKNLQVGRFVVYARHAVDRILIESYVVVSNLGQVPRSGYLAIQGPFSTIYL